MAVFIRKFKEGGGATSSEQTPPTNNLTDSEVQVPKFRIGNHEVNTSDYADALANNFQHFYDTYEGTWTNREKLEIIREHKLFLQNLLAGNITGMNEDGTFEVLDPGYSGLDFSEDGVGKRYSFYAKLVAGAARPNYNKEEAKKKNTFTNTSILKDFYNSFFGGVEKPDFRSFYDLDQVVEGPDGKKVRGVKNRVNAILDLLNENYMSKYDDADESLGGITGATERVNRLRRALADGTLNNEDYAAAAALGLNLRGLLSTDADISFDENGNFSTSTGSAQKTAGEQLREMLAGTSETEEQLLNRIKGWDVNINSFYRTRPMTNWSATDYLQKRMKTRNENTEYLQHYYSTEFYPKFFLNLKIITPEYLNTHLNEVIGTWQGDLKLGDYVSLNLTLAIRNKLYNLSSLLSTEISNELNQIVGTSYWTVPGSFDEETGTISLFDVNTGDYKRVSINNPNLKISIQGRTYTLMQDYLTSKGVKIAKYGAKLQLGGTLNSMVLSGAQEDKVAALNSLFAKPAETTKTPETTAQTPAATEPDVKTKQAEYLAQQGLNAADIRELTSAGLDLASLGAAYIPGYGTVASAITGLTSTGLHTYNLATDANGLTLGDIGETVGNVGLDLVGLIPGFGTSAKSGKILKTITKFAPILIGAFGVAQLPEAAASLKKLTTQGVSSLTVQDYRNLTNGIMAVTGAIQYHGIAKPKALAMSEANGRTVRQYGDMEVKIDGAKDNIKIESSELPEFKRKLESAGGNADAANRVLRESPSVRSEVKRRLGANATEEEIKAALDKITISKTPTATIKGKEVPFSPKSRGLEIKDEVIEGSSTLGNSLDERFFKWQQEKAEQLSNLKNPFKNPFKNYWRKRYGVETPKAESSAKASESEVPKRTTEPEVKETPKSEEKPLRTEEKPVEEKAVAESPTTESKKKQDVSEEKPKTHKIKESAKSESPTENAISTEIKNKKRENQTERERRNRTEKSESSRRQTNANTRNIRYYQNIAESLPSKYSKEKAQIIEELNSYKHTSNSERGKGGKKKRNRNKGGYKKFNPDRVEKILKPIREAGDVLLKLFRQGSKLLKLRLLKGGIIKAQSGLSLLEFENLYNFKRLGNENLKNHNQNINYSYVNDHNKDFSLGAAYLKNDFYTGQNRLIGEDLQNYYNTGAYTSIQDFVNQYNNDAAKIRGFWNTEHAANTERGEAVRLHNQLFKRMFKNRSLANNDNAAYNIGYDIGVEDIMGTSTWMRRMDRYKDSFENSLNKKSRIHKINLGNGKYGYVYKKEDGDIDILDNATAEAILSDVNPLSNPQSGSLSNSTDRSTEGNDFDWNRAIYGAGDFGEGSRKNIDLYKYLPATLAFGRMIGDIDSTNRRTKEYLSRLLVPLQLPWQFHRQVYGDYASLKEGENLAAQIRSNMNKPTTSNAQLALLGRLEGEKLASEQQWKGHIADNQMIHKTAEVSANEQKENIKRATDVANVNRGLLADDARARASVIAAADAANRNSLDTWLMNYVEKPIQEEADRRKAYQDYYDYISMGPMEYDFSTDAKILAWKDEYNSIKDSTKPEDIQRRKDIIREMDTYKKQKAASYKLEQLRKFRLLNPYIIQRILFDYNSNDIDPGRMSYDVESDKKGGSTSSYPAAVIRAKSKDNDRLIKQILEIIRNHKDLAKGVRMTDYSKYIVK